MYYDSHEPEGNSGWWKPTLIGGLLVLMCFGLFGCEEYRYQGTVVEKFITWDKGGHPQYHIIYRCTDGRIREEQVGVGEYQRNIGNTYAFSEPQLIWDPFWK
jgi:hypothetical protein